MYICNRVSNEDNITMNTTYDIKTHAVTHADLGQMQLYRNYYDMECRSEGDNQTIGLILCTEKNKKMVKYFLGDGNKNIYTYSCR